MTEVNKIISLFQEFGHSEYGGEPVSQLEHALQSAYLAQEARESESLVLACLLHDIGHLLHQLPNDAPEKGIDDLHENLGNEYLKNLFPESITEPIRLHVEAKRYLCAIEPNYTKILSPASVTSLNLQGGIMSKEECINFENNAYFKDGLKLRKYDDQAKIPNFPTHDITFYAPLLNKYIYAKFGN